MTVSREIFADRQLAVETRMLEHDAEASPHCDGLAREVVAEHSRATRLNRRQGREQFEQGGLAAAVGSEEAKDLAARDRKCDVAQRLAIAVAKAERPRLDGVGLGAKRAVRGLRWIRKSGDAHGSPRPPAGW